MKKFTLLLFSLFLTLGTAMAQDDALALQKTTPNSEQPVFSVSYLQLVFNKDVTATLPEGGIEVRRNGTDEVYKLTRMLENEWMPKNIVQFMFEQISIIGKDGKEELSEMELKTPGEYTYTIPAGVITSADGESFAEYTSTFTICETLEFVSVTPTETSKLETIQITFNKAISEVKMPANGLSVVDLYYTNFFKVKDEVALSEDKKTATLELETPITTIGMYYLDVSNGIFISEDGAMNQYQSLSFNVIDPAPSFSANYENNEEVKEIGDLELTFKNVNEVKLVEGADDAVIYMPGGGDATGSATLADNKITIKFNQEFTEEGIYTFFIPANFFTMDGVPNEVYELSVTLKTFALTPLEVLSVSPDAGSVENINRIVIAFNQPVSLAWDENGQQISREIKLTCGDKEYTLTNDAGNSASASNTLEYIANAEWDGYKYTSTPITAEGTYTLNLADIVVNYGAESYIDEYGWQNTRWNGTGSCEGTYTWTIASTGIEEVKGKNGKAKGIYDLQGRKVENPSKGMYIIDGKKVLVK